MLDPCWIMLISKIPTSVSPPRLSIHWSVPWPYEASKPKKSRSRLQLFSDEEYREIQEDVVSLRGGRSPNTATARAILYKGERIRVWDHEFSVLDSERVKLYVNGPVDAECWELIPSETAQVAVTQASLDPDSRMVRDAALVDGCTPAQAQHVALGIDILGELDFPPVGWYRCPRDVALQFCDEDEIKE